VAIYVKQKELPQLTLMRRSPTNDNVLLAQAWQAANAKVRTWVDFIRKSPALFAVGVQYA
jgi:hypothetical protein